MNPAGLSIAEARALMRDGSLTSVALTEAHLARIVERDPVYHAFVTVTADAALADAARADEEIALGIHRGALQGIPVALKDLIDTQGVRTTYGSRLHEGHVPARDAAVVTRLKEGGAVLIGKLATYEFALVGPSFDLPFPPAANPWNVDHITGGSSSGCASAVAGGLVRTSIGTDTGGSVRSPAGYCGVVGLKPTFGAVAADGVVPLSTSLDHVGPVSATVADAAATFDVVAGNGTRASAGIGQGIAGLRIAYARDWFAADPAAMPAIVAAMDEAASTLSLLGARIEEVAPPDYAAFEACGSVILHAEALAIHMETMRNQPGDYGRLAYQSLASGMFLTPDDLADAKRAGARLGDALDADIFSQFDALLTVNTLTTARAFADFDGRSAVWTPMRTIPFNVTGHPALALPAGFAAGLPIGLQLAGRHRDEATLCRIGHAFEQATDHSAMRPATVAVQQQFSD